MFRILLCMSCCSAPPANRSGKRKSSSNPNLQSKKGGSSKSLSDIQDDSIDKSKLEDANTTLLTLAASEKEQLLANQLQANQEDYGTKSEGAKGKLNLEIDSMANFQKTGQLSGGGREWGEQQSERASEPLLASSSQRPQQSAKLVRNRKRDTLDSFGDIELDSSLSENDGNLSAGSSTDIGPYTESSLAAQVGEQISAPEANIADGLESELVAERPEGEAGARVEERSELELAAAPTSARNVASTTKIGDYARLEYSPVEDLDSVTTMSYSRFGSERGAGGRSQAGSTLSRQNSLGRRTGATEESLSRRSSQAGMESTSLSIASQLSNEQFQQNLTNMLESVNNSNFPTFGTIGLPLGPPIEATFTTETTKTSPETPGAALTSASQDSLSDVSFDNEISGRPVQSATLRSNQSTGGALVNDSSQQERINTEEMAELAKPAPLASGEDEPKRAQIASVVTSGAVQPAPAASATEEARNAGERVGSPQSFTTTTSGALTNPTPTPSEMSTGSGKKKKLKAKALFKKLKMGKKKNKDEEEV